MSILSIAQKLNAMGIPNPSAYKRSIGLHYRRPNDQFADNKWVDSSVRRILGNQMYIGDLVQGVLK